MATCGATDGEAGSAVNCYVKNDSPKPFGGSVSVDRVDFATGNATTLKKLSLAMPAGAGVRQFFSIDSGFTLADGSTSMLQVTVTDSSGTIVSDNPVGFAFPGNMTLPKANVHATVTTTEIEEPGSLAPVDVTVTTDAFALYVTLTTLAQGRFEDNAFVMRPGSRTLKFFPFAGFELSELKATLRVEHTASYM